MAQFKKPQKSIETIVDEDGRYPLEAVQFIREGLNHTVEKYRSRDASTGSRRHVSGVQLCQGLRELALQRWGPMARFVLKNWNITTTRDFGEIVYLLVDNGWMQKEPTDSVEDFEHAYDFAEAFDDEFDFSSDPNQ